METKKLKQKLCWLMMLVAFLATSQGIYADTYLKGSFNSWGTGNKFSYSGTTGTTSISLSANSSYTFKIDDSSAGWFGNNGTITGTVSDWEFKSSDGDCHINTTIAGTYKFTWNSSTHKLSVTYPFPTLYLRGDVIKWDADNDTKMSESSGTYTKTVNSLSAKTYSIKVADSSWGSDNYGLDNGTITRNTNSITLQNNKGNVSFTADVAGNYTFTFVYSSKKLTVTYPAACTTPTATQYPMTSATKTYGSVTAPTITPASGAGAVKKTYYTGINGTSYNKSETLPTNAGTYKVTVDVNAGTTYCAKDGIELTGNFVINKASRTISITNSTTTFCQTATPTVTSTVSAGGTDGTITYTKTGGTATATVNSSTGVITCTAPGTVIVKASISAGTNYEAAVSTTKTFTFDASTVAGQVYVTGTTSSTVSICSGGSTSLTSYNKTGSVVKWMYQEGDEVGTSTWHDIASSAVDTYTPQNLTQQTRYKVSVKNGACGSGGSGYTTVSIASSEITQVLPAPTFEAVAIGSTGTAKNFQFTACGISINPSDLNITLYSDASHGGVDGRTQFQLGTPTLSAGVLTVPVSFKPTKNNTSGTNEWGAQIRLATKDESYIKKSAVFTAAVTCTAVTSSQYTLSGNSYTYDGTNKTVTVTPKTGAGAVSKIMYAGVEGGKTNAGTYAITINSALGDKYCAASGLNVGNLTISKKAPVVGDFNITIPASREYDGTAKAATVVAKGGITGMGAVTVKYNGNTTVPTAAGTYTVTFDVAAGDNYSAKADLSAGTMTITKASRTITLDNTDLINCQTSPFALTSTVNKGSGDGAVTYQITGGTGVGSIAGSTLSCTTPGTVIVKAKVAEGTNYQADESTTKTFTFQPSSVGGTLAPATADVCYGGSQELTLSGQTGTIQKWQYSYDGTSWNDITSTDNPYNVENIQNNLQLRVVVKSGECAAANSAVSAITVKGAPISIAGSGAKSTSATYPWEYFNFTATTTATDTQITWNCVYSTSLEASKTVFEWSGKTAKLKSGAPASESAHYTVTAKTNVGGCELTSSGYDVYINAAPAEDCGK